MAAPKQPPTLRISAKRNFGDYCAMLRSLQEDGIPCFSMTASGSAIARAASLAAIAQDSHGYLLCGSTVSTLPPRGGNRTTQMTLWLGNRALCGGDKSKCPVGGLKMCAGKAAACADGAACDENKADDGAGACPGECAETGSCDE